MRRRRGVSDDRQLCSGPGKICEALGVTRAPNGLALDRAPFALRARAEKPEIVAGVRIGITKAAELPWRYGLRASRYLSKPFPRVEATGAALGAANFPELTAPPRRARS
jgi:DNA-3-methyladenine glycosylase